MLSIVTFYFIELESAGWIYNTGKEKSKRGGYFVYRIVEAYPRILAQKDTVTMDDKFQSLIILWGLLFFSSRKLVTLWQIRPFTKIRIDKISIYLTTLLFTRFNKLPGDLLLLLVWPHKLAFYIKTSKLLLLLWVKWLSLFEFISNM